VCRYVLALLAALALAGAGCAGPAASRGPLPSGTDDEAARAVLARFAGSLEAGRFDDAHALLSARWRAAYTPGRLALDFRGAGAQGREASARVLGRLAAGARLERSEAGARLPGVDGRAAVLVVEEGGWRVDALE
jgi:hypothetical protein